MKLNLCFLGYKFRVYTIQGRIEHDTYIPSFELIKVCFGFYERAIASITTFSENIQKHIGVSSGAKFVTGINGNFIQ